MIIFYCFIFKQVNKWSTKFSHENFGSNIKYKNMYSFSSLTIDNTQYFQFNN